LRDFNQAKKNKKKNFLNRFLFKLDKKNWWNYPIYSLLFFLIQHWKKKSDSIFSTVRRSSKNLLEVLSKGFSFQSFYFWGSFLGFLDVDWNNHVIHSFCRILIGPTSFISFSRKTKNTKKKKKKGNHERWDPAFISWTMTNYY